MLQGWIKSDFTIINSINRNNEKKRKKRYPNNSQNNAKITLKSKKSKLERIHVHSHLS